MGRGATELLRQIKQHSGPTGDATQRLAHCFAEGLEARLAGTGSQVYCFARSALASAHDACSYAYVSTGNQQISTCMH